MKYTNDIRYIYILDITIVLGYRNIKSLECIFDKSNLFLHNLVYILDIFGYIVTRRASYPMIIKGLHEDKSKEILGKKEIDQEVEKKEVYKNKRKKERKKEKRKNSKWRNLNKEIGKEIH